MSVSGMKGENSARNQLLPTWPCPQSPSLPCQRQLLPGAQTADPFAMLVVSGPEPLFCLLLLLLQGPYSSVGASPPHRRFEYKLSFKGPRLALPGAGIPFWSHHGDAMLGPEEVRLVPSMQNRSGAVWSRVPVLFSAWEVEVQMRVTGPRHRGARGVAVWYTRDRGQIGSVPEGPTSWDGIGILFDSSDEDTQNSPAIRVLASDGHTRYEARGDGAGSELGTCRWDFRNLPHPFRARITYWGQRLRVSLNSGLTPGDQEEVCVDTGPLLLAPGGFFGVSAATNTLADDHDILSFLTFSLSELGPKPPPQPFLEMEELRLARQLEGLWARLALGTKEHVIPQRSSEVQEEGERSFVLAEMLGRHRQTLQALQGLSEQLAQAERQWKKQLGSLGHTRPMGTWDLAKVSALLRGQRTLLQDLQEMRDAAAHVASRAQLFYLPVGTKHHFLELAQILSFLQKDLQGPLKAAAKNAHPPGQLPGASSCLRPRMFLFFLLIQTVGFFCYVHFSRQELDKSLWDCLSAGKRLCPEPRNPGALGVLRRQPLSLSIHARLT
ncbi:protein ERGIC-53-like isoform X1 [Mustela lutreola]|uniref:protein ERGIC-53-like isoform X1 n=1 Tax=Mustela lutreola TaxID=9666 RepID=UPI002797BF2E|nr:protein ERGIC-53-like isoform X1 [Mustela lutreola]